MAKDHEYDEDLVFGLIAAIGNLPSLLRPYAYEEFKRGLRAGFTRLSKPELIAYRVPGRKRLKHAKLVHVETPNFIFDVFLVKNRLRLTLPVIGRCYVRVPLAKGDHVN